MNEFERALKAFDIGAFVERHGGHKESRYGFEYLLTCPWCGSGRLRWNHPAKCAWICWGCKRGGDSLTLIQSLEKIPTEKALDLVLGTYVGGDATGQLGAISPAALQARRVITPMPWPDGVDLIDPRNKKHEAAIFYLAKRGISKEQIETYRIGVGVSGRFAKYVVFPVYEDGRLMYFQGRATWDPPAVLDKETRKVWIKATGYRKTLNPFTSENHASAQDALFNYDAAKNYPTVVVCEGPVDAIKSGPNAVALFGKIASAQKVQKLKAMSALDYVIYLDRGTEERAAAERLANELAAVANVRIATPPEDKDPGALSLQENALVIRGAEKWQGARVLKTQISF